MWAFIPLTMEPVNNAPQDHTAPPLEQHNVIIAVVVVKQMVTPPRVFSAPLENSPRMMERVNPALSPNTPPLLDHANVIHVGLDQRLSMEPPVNYARKEHHQVMEGYVKPAPPANMLPPSDQRAALTAAVERKRMQTQQRVCYVNPAPSLPMMAAVNSALLEAIHPMPAHVYAFPVEQDQVQTLEEQDVIYVNLASIPPALELANPALLVNTLLAMEPYPV